MAGATSVTWDCLRVCRFTYVTTKKPTGVTCAHPVHSARNSKHNIHIYFKIRLYTSLAGDCRGNPPPRRIELALYGAGRFCAVFRAVRAIGGEPSPCPRPRHRRLRGSVSRSSPFRVRPARCVWADNLWRTGSVTLKSRPTRHPTLHVGVERCLGCGLVRVGLRAFRSVLRRRMSSCAARRSSAALA
jgi:hypothetical protein